jgi:transcriptional regulator with XRE-family HTH domain
MSTPERQVLDAAMDRRRAQLGLNWAEVAERAGLSVATLRRARRGPDELSIDTVLGIERALRWAGGSVATILKGGDPVELAPVAPAASGVEAGLIQILEADHRELVLMFRTVEAERGGVTAENWLVDALDVRERARRLNQATKRDGP